MLALLVYVSGRVGGDVQRAEDIAPCVHFVALPVRGLVP
jgi:hypothetical protein